MSVSSELIQRLRREFTLDWTGIHGAPHWARVRENGLRLSEITGANPKVIEAFAFHPGIIRWAYARSTRG